MSGRPAARELPVQSAVGTTVGPRIIFNNLFDLNVTEKKTPNSINIIQILHTKIMYILSFFSSVAKFGNRKFHRVGRRNILFLRPKKMMKFTLFVSLPVLPYNRSD